VTVIEELAERGRRAASSSDRRARDCATLHLLDTIGCQISGAGHPLARQLDRWLTRDENESQWQRLLVAATLTHVDEFDSIHGKSAVLPCATVVPAAIDVAAQLGRSGRELIDAVLAGSEVCIEAGLRFGGAYLYSRGWWPTALFGGLGAAAAASVLLDLNRADTATALALCASGLGGLLSEDTLGAGHYLLVGRAAADGVGAAFAARAGLTASLSLLDGPAGSAFGLPAGEPTRSEAAHLLTADFKLYPCARPLHPVISLLEALMADGVDLSAARLIVVSLPTPVHRFVTTERRPAGPTEAAASLSCAIDAVIAGVAWSPEFYREIREATGPAVRLESLAELDAQYPQHWGAHVVVVHPSGEMVSRTALDGPGQYDSDSLPAEVMAKFRRVTGGRAGHLSGAWAEQLFNVDGIADVGALVTLVRQLA
jgi:2-methylcitrate dehydratase PrpD